jgi:hypothetical protein
MESGPIGGGLEPDLSDTSALAPAPVLHLVGLSCVDLRRRSGVSALGIPLPLVAAPFTAERSDSPTPLPSVCPEGDKATAAAVNKTPTAVAKPTSSIVVAPSWALIARDMSCIRHGASARLLRYACQNCDN